MRWLVAAVIATHLIAAWFNAGYLNTDEHYQIIEFAQYKLGYQSAAALAWEFPAHMRPALQPWLATIAIRVNHLLGVTSPFVIAFSLRLVSSLLAIAVSFELCFRCLGSVSSQWARKAGLFLAFFLWIVPTVHGRFSSENWGGIWLAAGLCCLLDADDAWPSARARSLCLAACAGAAWSIAFYCRFQMAIAITGAGLWLLILRRRSAAIIPAIALSFAAGGAANEVVDHWLYGAWTFASANYFNENLVLGKAATFGTAPWWMIGVYAAIVLIPPFSLAVIALLASGCWSARRHVIVWTAVPFVVVHAILARKDARFLIPLLYLIGPWFAISVDGLPPRIHAWLDRRRTAVNAGVAAFCTIDVLVLCVAIAIPVTDHIRVDRWLWDAHQHGLQTLYTIGRLDPGLPANVTDSFYGSGAVMTPFTTTESLREANVRPPVFVYYRGTDMPSPLTAAGCAPILQSYPEWLTGIAFFRRLSHVEPQSICRLDELR